MNTDFWAIISSLGRREMNKQPPPTLIVGVILAIINEIASFIFWVVCVHKYATYFISFYALKLKFKIFKVMCIPTQVYVHHVCKSPESIGLQILWKWTHRQLSAV